MNISEKDTSTVNCVGPHETVLGTALSRLSEYPLLSIFLRKSKEVPAYLAFFRCTPPP